MVPSASNLSTPPSITLRDGRILSYAIYGTDVTSAPTIFYFYSYPDSLVGGRIFDAAARERGLRIVVPDRPGIGASTFQPRRKMASWPDDVLQLADSPAVAAGSFAVLGIVGGAPFVLACCAKIPPNRLRAAGILNGVYPSSLGLSSYGFGVRMYRRVAPWVPFLISRSVDSSYGQAERKAEQLGRVEASVDAEVAGRDASSWSQVKVASDDKEAMDEEKRVLQEMITAGTRGAFQGKDGSRAVSQDVGLAMGDWGFDLREVEMEKGRLVIWHREGNVKNPVEVAARAHALLRGSEFRVSSGGGANPGSSVVMERIAEMLDTLKERMVC